MKFDNPNDYKEALLQEVENKSNGNAALFAEHQRDIALERVAARLDHGEVAVKGGFGVRTLVQSSPLTTDIDVLIDKAEWQSLSREQQYQLCSEYIMDCLSAQGGDNFRFNLTGLAQIVDTRLGHAVSKMWIQAKVGDEPFANLQIDVGIQPPDFPTQKAEGRDVLAFADIENPTITTATREFLAADKISLFLDTGMDRPRDIVHAALLLNEKLDPKALLEWLEKLSELRGVQDKLSLGLEEPSREGLGMVQQICQKYALPLNAKECFERVNGFLDRLFDRESKAPMDRSASNQERSDSGRGDHTPPEAPQQPARPTISGRDFADVASSSKQDVPRTNAPAEGRSSISGRSFTDAVRGDQKQGPSVHRSAGPSKGFGATRTTGGDRGSPTGPTSSQERSHGYGQTTDRGGGLGEMPGGSER